MSGIKRIYYRGERRTVIEEIQEVGAVYSPADKQWCLQFRVEMPAESEEGRQDLARVFRKGDATLLANGPVSFQFSVWTTKARIEEALARHGLALREALTFAENCYVAVPVARKLPDALELANNLREEAGCLWAEPVFLEYIGPRVSKTE